MTQLEAPPRLAEPQAAALSPIARAFRAFEQKGMHALYARARKEEPVFFAPEIGYWVVTRHADILAIFRDTQRFSAANALSPVTPLPPEVTSQLKAGGFTTQPVQVNSDPPVHGRIRALAGQFLNGPNFNRYEPQIRALIDRHLDRLEDQTEADLVATLTYELPARVIFLLMGIPEVDTAAIKRWADDRLLVTWGRLPPEDQARAATEMLDYWNYCKALVAARQAEPQDDYPSTLLKLRDGDDTRLSLNEIVCLVFGILLAGHETTTNSSTNLIQTLLTHRQEWERLQADPTLIPNAVEEGLRFATSVVAWRRIAREEVEVAGQRFPAGTQFLLSLSSAGRDEAVFTDPERFDIGRENARRHLAFGHGIHVCIGAPLARLQLRLLLEVLIRRFPRMSLVPGQRPDWVRTISFRGPTSLWVRPNG